MTPLTRREAEIAREAFVACGDWIWRQRGFVNGMTTDQREAVKAAALREYPDPPTRWVCVGCGKRIKDKEPHEKKCGPVVENFADPDPKEST